MTRGRLSGRQGPALMPPPTQQSVISTLCHFDCKEKSHTKNDQLLRISTNKQKRQRDVRRRNQQS